MGRSLLSFLYVLHTRYPIAQKNDAVKIEMLESELSTAASKVAALEADLSALRQADATRSTEDARREQVEQQLKVY